MIDSKLREYAKALIDKLELMHNAPSYTRVWKIAAIHGCIYYGPYYGKELEDLKKEINNVG